MDSIVLCVGTVGICKIEEDLPVRPTCRCLGLAVCLSLSIAALSTSLGIGLGLCICLCSCKESNSLFSSKPEKFGTGLRPDSFQDSLPSLQARKPALSNWGCKTGKLEHSERSRLRAATSRACWFGRLSRAMLLTSACVSCGIPEQRPALRRRHCKQSKHR